MKRPRIKLNPVVMETKEESEMPCPSRAKQCVCGKCNGESFRVVRFVAANERYNTVDWQLLCTGCGHLYRLGIINPLAN